MGSAVSIPVAWVVFPPILTFLAGIGLKHLVDGLYWGYRSLRMPDPDVYEPVEPEPARTELDDEDDVPEYVPPTHWPTEVLTPRPPVDGDEDLAQLHTRARDRQWHHPQTSQAPLEDAVMFDQTLTDLLQRSQMPALPSVPSTGFDPFPTGAYATVDLDLDDLPAPAPETVVESPVLPTRQRFTGTKRKPSKRLAGVR